MFDKLCAGVRAGMSHPAVESSRSVPASQLFLVVVPANGLVLRLCCSRRGGNTQHEGGSCLGEPGALRTHRTFPSRAERSWKHPQVPGVCTQLRAGCAVLSPLRNALSSGTSLPSRCSGTTRWVQCVSTWCLVCPRLGRVRCSTCFPSPKNGDARGCQTLPVAEGRQCHSSPQQEPFPALLAAKRFAFQ